MSIAFVVGNGVSRKPIDLTELQKHGPVYACNAVYRDFKPDYLIAVDPKMVIEICHSNYHVYNKVWTNPNKRYQEFKRLNYFNPSKGWSSGPTALHLASEHGYEKIYILGFDYSGLENNTIVNNIFSGTKNYKSSDAKATYYGNWVRQTRTVITNNEKISYIRVITPDNLEPPQLNNSNYKTEEIHIFLKNLQNGSF